MSIRIAILSVSDRASAGTYEDRGGPAVEAVLETIDALVVERKIVPDDRDLIASAIGDWADNTGVDVVLTTGGTGLGPRDVTPEATLDACERPVPGVAEAIRAFSLSQTQHAMLSRGIAAVRGTTLVINLPGSPRGAAEAAQVVAPVLEHAVHTLHGGKH